MRLLAIALVVWVVDGFVLPQLRFGLSPTANIDVGGSCRGQWPRVGVRMSGKEDGEVKKGKVPDAITQTDNSAKRQLNAQMRAKNLEAEEPAALREMRLKREAEEEAAAEAQAELGREDAEKRAKTGNFVSGQDLREQRIAEKMTQAGKGGGGESSEVPSRDIRETLKKMQGSEKRRRADEESLLHQSLVDSPPLDECKEEVMSFLNRHHATCLGKFAMNLNASVAKAAGRANTWQNGAYVIPDARIRAMDKRGFDLEARVVETGFFGDQKERTMDVRVDYINATECTHVDEVKVAVIAMMRACGLVKETASVLEMSGLGSK